MKKILLLYLIIVLSQKNFAQQPPCSGTPGPATVTPVTSTICINGSATLAPSVLPSGTGITYQWQSSGTSSVGPFANVASGGNNAIYYTPPLATSQWYLVIINCSNAGGPTTSSPAQVVVTSCTGINKQNNYTPGLRIYPNPVNQAMIVEMPEADENTVLRVYSADGRKVAVDYHSLNSGKLQMNVGSLATGMYILEISSQSQSIKKVFCVEH